MDKKDILILSGICIGSGVAVTLMIFLANGIFNNPFV
jgi:hypothetical protein